ncbi:helix-turn-helix domain-containing protein [Candidatus Deferrimicrobium sp.]|uniref:helix-turn-helix domain-containing protein n=1 Tax=Candidatus Deferrimicrobium sp. TaxID=3060586 RepID=UPI00272B9654|nr:helix-turn-helix domain-containing protein [Candidatus Deferrimicrobium sp.]
MQSSQTQEEMEIEFGRQLRDLRLRRNIDQRQLAEQAGVALNAVKNLENGRGATLSSLVKVLRSLGRADWLKTLAPTVGISPMQMLKTRQPRQRASKNKGPSHV